MMPVNHKSMMNVVPIAARQSEKGANTMVPKLVMMSPTICAARLSAVMPYKRAPAARLAQDPGEQPGQEQRPQRQQQDGMRDAAMMLEVRHRAGVADDEVEVRRRGGEEAGGDAARQLRGGASRARCARASSAPDERVRQRVQEPNQRKTHSRRKWGPSLFLRLGGALLALGVARMQLRVGAVRGGFRVAHVQRQAHVDEHRAERREAQHDVVGAAGITHQPEAPDLALQAARGPRRSPGRTR